MENKIMRNSMFGFKKDDVVSYIEKITSELNSEIINKDNEINDLKKKLNEVTESLKVFELERGSISSTMVKAEEYTNKLISDAQKEAEEIISEAKKEADNMRLEAFTEIQAENKKLMEIKNEIFKVKKFAIEAMEKFSKEIDNNVTEG